MLDKIIKSCKYVTNNSKSVKINETNLDKFIGKIKKVETEHWLAFSPYNLLDLPTETIINFLLVYEAIDFSFWGNPKWTIDTDNGKEDGSIALLYAILKYVKERNTTDFSNITKDEFREIFNDHDFIISKGMGNYEGLTEIDTSDKDLYFLFCSKCDVISRDIGVNLQDMVILKAN